MRVIVKITCPNTRQSRRRLHVAYDDMRCSRTNRALTLIVTAKPGFYSQTTFFQVFKMQGPALGLEQNAKEFWFSDRLRSSSCGA